MTSFIGSIENEINFIRDYWKKTKHESESLIRYYNQINQPTHVKDFRTKELIPFDNYFGGYSPHLKDPFIFWNGFYIQPFKVQSLLSRIKDQLLYFNGKIVTDINEIKEHIFSYKEGFELGFKHFDFTEIESKSSVFKSDNRSIEKVINFIEFKKDISKAGFSFNSHFNGNFKEYCPCRNNYKEIEYKSANGLKIYKDITCECSKMPNYKGGEVPCYYCPLTTLPDLKSWKEKGFENGKYYRAWFIMLSNFIIFDEYFKNQLNKTLPPQQTTEQMKENLLQLVACSKGDEIIDEIDKIYLDKSLSTSRKIVLIGDRKDIFKLGENNIKDGVVSISFDGKKYINSFLNLLISGIYELQEKRGDKEYFIHYLKKNNEKDEAGFRDWFSEFFQRYGCKTLPERKKENKKIDLVVKHDDFGEKKIEFKIWYNPDKEEIVNQIYSYLTDFNNEGYIFMINDTKSPIIDEYKKIVTQNPQNKWDEKWETQVYNGLPYYTSRHNIGANPKTIHHFIFNIYP